MIRGLRYAIPISLAMWGLIIWIIVGCAKGQVSNNCTIDATVSAISWQWQTGEKTEVVIGPLSPPDPTGRYTHHAQARTVDGRWLHTLNGYTYKTETQDPWFLPEKGWVRDPLKLTADLLAGRIDR